MQKFIVPAFVALAAFAFATPALAKDSSKPMTAHQAAFADCAHQSKGIKGDAHKKFMSDCLKGKKEAKADAAAPKAEEAAPKADAAVAKTEATAPKSKAESQREKMKTCNADAKSKKLKGADRKAFMSTCLKAG